MRRNTQSKSLGLALSLSLLALCSCGGASANLVPDLPQLRVLDSAGRELPATAARLNPTPAGCEVYALDLRAAGFVVAFDQLQQVADVEQGSYFGSADLFLAVSELPGRVDIGGYHLSPVLPIPSGGLLVASIRLASGPARSASAQLPTASGCIARNFSYLDEGDGSVTFSWTFHNTGDYNQDGEVNISDITPIGINFGKHDGGGDWASASLADGDENGEVNIGDLTPIGQNYQTLVSGYKLEQSSAASGPFSERASFATGEGVAAPALSFSFHDSSPVQDDWYRVRAYSVDGPGLGAATEPLQLSLLPPGLNPVAVPGSDLGSGIVPLTVNFNAAASHDDDGSIVRYEWDLDGNNTFETDATAQSGAAQYTYTEAGSYTVRLRVTDDSQRVGAASLIIIAEPPLDSELPSAFAYVMPNQGWAPLDIRLSAFGSDDNVGISSYAWDLDGDGTYETDATGSGGYASGLLSTPGLHNVGLQLKDAAGNTAQTAVSVNVWDPASLDVDYAAAFPQDSVARVDISVSQVNWDAMNVDPQAELEVPADAVVNGVSLPNLGLSYKGNSSLNNPFEKKPFKFDIDKYDPLQEYYNMKALIFNNAFKDPSMVREALAYRLMYQAGCWASHTSFVEIWISIGGDAPEFYGVYTMLERVDNKFLGNRSTDDTGNLYKAYMGADLSWKGSDINLYPKYEGEPVYAKKNNEGAADWSDIINLLQVINQTPDETFKSELEAVFNVDSFLRYMAVTWSHCNLDMYVYMSQNYYLYNDPAQGNKFVWIPWDLNETWGLFGAQDANANHPLLAKTDIGMGSGGSRPLFERVFAEPEYRLRLAAYYDLFRRSWFDYATVRAQAQQMHDFIEPSVDQGDKMPFPMSAFDTNWGDTDYTGGGGPGGFPAYGIAHFTQLRNQYVDEHLLEELGSL